MAKASENKKQWFSRKNIVAVILLSISFSFTVFFFSPMDIFLGNQKEFYVNAYSVILPMLFLSLAGSIALIIVGALSLLHKTAYNIFTCVIFGLLLAFYIQMMLFNGDLRLLDGDDSSDLYSDITFFNMFNFIAVYAVFVMPLILTLAREKYGKNNRIMNFAKGKMIPYLSAVIFVIQLLGSAGMLISNGLIKTDEEQYVSFSFEPVMSVSKEDNITVFLLDRLDGIWLDETLEMYPEMNDKLEGFTFYQNNISCYSNTFPSVACMFTNTVYSVNESKFDFIDRAWQEESVTDILFENDYRINLFLDRATTFNNFYQLSECSNIVPLGSDDYEINYLGRNGIVDVMTKLSFIKLVPYFFKGYFTLSLIEPVDEDFMTVSEDLPDTLVRLVSSQSDVVFSECLNKYGLKDDSEQKTFSFIHFDCAHSRSPIVARLSPYNSNDYKDIHTTIRGDFETLFTYFDMMKELGVYDNSTIIIVADHGRPNEINTASLLIKPRNSKAEPLQFDSVSELSNANFFPSILEYAGIDHSEYGCSYNDIIRGGLHQDRYFMHAYGSKTYTKMFMVTGNARDESSWTEIPMDK